MSSHNLELLAPVGKMNRLRAVVDAGADAVYLGGKRFNMRALRADFNLSDNEIIQAADILHQKDKKLYITVNNLYSTDEIAELGDYLFFLQDTGVDALIVQDIGVAELCTRLKIKIPLHASVQMGIANLEAVKILAENGFQRVILSKNLALDEIAAIAAGTDIGIEYFVHGDLCISHTGQCYMSSFTGGQSGNRGRCEKPCRWPFKLLADNEEKNNEYQYLLAHKDLCLYQHLPELVNAGVSSFKIEGRMRSPEYLSFIVSTYRQALDRFVADAGSYQTDPQELSTLEEHRVRDYTTANLWGRMGREGIAGDGLREPVIISTAHHFKSSEPGDFKKAAFNPHPAPEMTVRVAGIDSFRAILKMEPDNIILGCEQIRQNQHNWTPTTIQNAIEMASDSRTRVFLETPRIVSQSDLKGIKDLRTMLDDHIRIYGLVVNDLGSLNIFRNLGLPIWAGYGLNVFNSSAAVFLKKEGISRITASLEIDGTNLRSMIQEMIPLELMVHGPLPGMVSDYCIIRAAWPETEAECPMYCLRNECNLMDKCGQKYKIYTDDNCRNYLLYPYDLCLFPYLAHLSSWGIQSIRIDGQYYLPEKLVKVVEIYSEALQQIKCGQWAMQDNYAGLLDLSPEGLTTALFGTMPELSEGDCNEGG